MMCKKWCVALLLVLCVSITGVANGDIIFHLPLDSDYADATGNYAGITTAGGANVTDGALALDGDGDYLTVPGGIDLGTGDFTWAMWVKVGRKDNPTGGTGARHQLVMNGQTPTNASGSVPNLQLFVESHTGNGAGKLGFYAYSTSDDQFKDAFSTATVDDNEWHHVAVAVNRGGSQGAATMTVSFYIDGEFDSSTTRTEATSSFMLPFDTSLTPVDYASHANSDTLEIGRHWDNTGRYTDGLIDDVRVYNEALDATAMASLAATSVPEPSVFILLSGMIFAGWAIRRK